MRKLVLSALALGLAAFAATPLAAPRTNCDPDRASGGSCFLFKAHDGSRLPRRLVVFVHGIWGGQPTSWREANAPSWPQLLHEDPAFKDFDVYLVKYRVPIDGSAPPIASIAGQELARLMAASGQLTSYSQVYFIGHSTGGLLAKQMVMSVSHSAGAAAAQKVKGVLLLGTPSRGLDAASAAALYRGPGMPFDAATLAGYQQTLDRNWARFVAQRAEPRFPRIGSLVEGKPTRFEASASRFVVPYASNEPGVDQREGMDLDHVQLSRPVGRDAEQFRWGTDFLKRTVLEADRHFGSVYLAIWEPSPQGAASLRLMRTTLSAARTAQAGSIELSGTLAPTGRQWAGDRGYTLQGYKRGDVVSLSYTSSIDDRVGIGTMFLAMGRWGDSYAGSVTGTNCGRGGTKRYSAALVQSDSEQRAIALVQQRYAPQARIGHSHMMPFDCGAERQVVAMAPRR